MRGALTGSLPLLALGLLAGCASSEVPLTAATDQAPAFERQRAEWPAATPRRQ